MTSFFFFNDTATTEIYTLSLHDALPISVQPPSRIGLTLDRKHFDWRNGARALLVGMCRWQSTRSEEHTSELQSRLHLVCRLLLEKKQNITEQSSFSDSHSTTLELARNTH